MLQAFTGKRKLIALVSVAAVAFSLAFSAGVLKPPAYAQADSLPAPHVYQKKGATWKARSARTYLYARPQTDAKAVARKKGGKPANAKALKAPKRVKVKGGLVQLGKKLYYFDAAGVQEYGWQRVAPSYYAFFERANGKGGAMVKSKIVEGVELDKNGYAKLNERNLPELELYVKANDIVEQVTRPRWSQEKKLLACFDYFATFKHFKFYRPRKYSSYEAQHVDYALDLLDPDKRKGDCDSWGVAFSYVSVALGYPDALYVTRGGHAWIEINGLIYDPEWSAGHSRTFAIHYGELPGNDPNKKYTYPHVTYRVFPEHGAWAGESVPHVKLGKTRTLVKFDGQRYFAGKDGYTAANWATCKKQDYYFKQDGTAVSGSYRAKRDGKNRWFVFRENNALVAGNGTMLVPVSGDLYLCDGDGRALSGEHGGKFYLPTGKAADAGIQLSDGKFYAISDNGSIDASRTEALNAAAVQKEDATTLLSLLGEPKKVTESASCLNYLGYAGTDKVYKYANFKVQTFACPELGEIYWTAY